MDRPLPVNEGPEALSQGDGHGQARAAEFIVIARTRTRKGKHIIDAKNVDHRQIGSAIAE